MLYERLERVICENDEKVGGRWEATLKSQQAEPENKIRGLSTPLANKYYQGKKKKNETWSKEPSSPNSIPSHSITPPGRKKKERHVYDHSLGPNVSPGCNVINGAPNASSVFIHTVFPHQFKKIVLFFGSCSAKKMTMSAMATPVSRPAERM